MAFRDDAVANRSRVDVLEAQLARLNEENETLRTSAGRALAPQARSARRGALVVAIAACALGAAAWYVGFVVGGLAAEQVAIALAVAAAIGLVGAGMLASLADLLIVVPPNRVAVIVGRKEQHADGQARGFRIVTGGRAIRVPFLEAFAMLPDGPFLVDTFVRSVSGRRSALADVRIRASLQFDRAERKLVNAVERFLGATGETVTSAAQNSLEGALRNVAANLDPEELAQEREKVAQEIRHAVEEDLDRLGLVIDTLHVVDVETRT